MDKAKRLAPIGAVGELYVGGEGLALGYINSETTKKFFIENPYKENTILYKTGDLVQFLPDGNLDFIGREDNQVKIRGFRIETGEIESVLSEHSLVKQSFITTYTHENKNKSLVAYVVINYDLKKNGGKTDKVNNDSNKEISSVLRSYLKQRLPRYMVPSFFVFLDHLELTKNGKIDRRRLPDPLLYSEVEKQSNSKREFLNQSEEIIYGVFKDVLGVRNLSKFDNFFDNGGNSLSAMQVISRLSNLFNLEVTLHSLFSNPTVSALSKNFETLVNERPSNNIPILTPSEGGNKYNKLSFAQRRLWFLQQFSPDDNSYNLPIVLKISGNLNISVIEDSINEILNRHDSLRTISVRDV